METNRNYTFSLVVHCFMNIFSIKPRLNVDMVETISFPLVVLNYFYVPLIYFWTIILPYSLLPPPPHKSYYAYGIPPLISFSQPDDNPPIHVPFPLLSNLPLLYLRSLDCWSTNPSLLSRKVQMSSNDPSSLYPSIFIPSFQLVLVLPGSPNPPAVLLNPQPSYRRATSGPDVVDIDFVNAVTPVETRLFGLIECLLTQWRHVLSDNTDKASCVSLITFNRSRALINLSSLDITPASLR